MQLSRKDIWQSIPFFFYPVSKRSLKSFVFTCNVDLWMWFALICTGEILDKHFRETCKNIEQKNNTMRHQFLIYSERWKNLGHLWIIFVVGSRRRAVLGTVLPRRLVTLIPRQDAHNDVRYTIPINERRRREAVVAAVCCYASAESTTSSIMETRPRRPHDSAPGHAEWHCYAAFASGRRRPRGTVGGPYKDAREAGEAIVRKSATTQANALSHAMGHWHPVCGLLSCGVKSHTKATQRTLTDEQRRETDKPRHERLRRYVS